jgi:hypothetical protein
MRRLLTGLALVFPFAAAPALADGQWGALALSERSTAYGYAFDHDTQEAAAARALAECQKNAQDCRVHTTFRNTCLVLAGSVDGPFGWAWGAREASREQRAIEQCRQRGAVNCRVVERVCTGSAGGPRTPATPARTQEPPPAAPPRTQEGPPVTPARTHETPPATASPPPANMAPHAGDPPAARDPRGAGPPTQLHRN